jgi:glycosyltransferase involved in cell wall biosynthesis
VSKTLLESSPGEQGSKKEYANYCGNRNHLGIEVKIAIDTLFEDPNNPTGSIDYLRNVARLFPKVGSKHDFHFLVSKRGLRHFQEFEASNLHFIECPSSNEKMAVRILLQQGLFPALLKSHDIDLLFSPGNVCPFLGDFCRVLKVNTLHHYHTPELCGKTRTLYRKIFFRESARRADHILANTELTKSEICKFMDVPEEKVTVVGEAFYDVYEPVSPSQALSVRTRYGLDGDYILFVSLLYPYKNIGTLIKAMKHLIGRGRDLKLAIVGRDFEGQQAKLQCLSEELGITSRVAFLGFVPIEDLPAIYSGAQVFVFPSLVETFGKPLVEAMRCGAPIVASNTSCIPEVLGGAGLLVDPLDPVEMASAIVRVIENQDLRRSMVETGFKRAQSFSWETRAKQTLGVIERTFERWRALSASPEVARGT